MRPVSWLAVPAVLLMACGGQDAPPAPPAPGVDPVALEAFSATFLELEGDHIGEDDTSGPVAQGEALGFKEPLTPGCVTVTALTPTAITWQLTNCPGPQGWIWNGELVHAWQMNPDGSVQVKHTRNQLVGTKDSKRITLNGTRNLLRNRVTRQVVITTEPGFTKAFFDGTTTRTFVYACALTADWSTPGTRKLHGTWSMTPDVGEAVRARIEAATPLTWLRGCCHPQAGTLTLSRGTQTRTLVFGSPCGTVSVDGQAGQLGSCR